MNSTWVINTYKNLPYLKLAIQSIERNAFYKDSPIVIYCENDPETLKWAIDGGWYIVKDVDDYLIDPLHAYMPDVMVRRRFIYEENETPRGIGGGVNQAMRLVETEFFNLLHSDMYIAKNYDYNLHVAWYHATGQTRKPHFVSATRIEPDIFGNPSSRPGTIIVPTDAFGEFHHNFDYEAFEEWAIEFGKVNPITCHRKLEGVSYFGLTKEFIATGMNDPLFAPASWEDMDLSIRMHCMGIDCLTTSDALVYHFGSRGAIFRDDDLTKRHPRQIEAERVNIKKWIDKWRELPTFDEFTYIKLTPTLETRFYELYPDAKPLPMYVRANT